MWVRSELGGLAPGRALDVGAGDGRNAVWLATRGWRVQASGPAEGLRIGRERARAERVQDLVVWAVADGRSCSPALAAVDAVVCVHLDLGARETRDAIARAAPSLVPGGRLLMVGRAPENLTEGTGGPRDPAVLHSAGRVAGWLRSAGLHVEVSGVRAQPVRGERRPALDCVVLARAPSRAGGGRAPS